MNGESFVDESRYWLRMSGLNVTGDGRKISRSFGGRTEVGNEMVCDAPRGGWLIAKRDRFLDYRAKSMY